MGRDPAANGSDGGAGGDDEIPTLGAGAAAGAGGGTGGLTGGRTGAPMGGGLTGGGSGSEGFPDDPRGTEEGTCAATASLAGGGMGRGGGAGTGESGPTGGGAEPALGDDEPVGAASSAGVQGSAPDLGPLRCPAGADSSRPTIGDLERALCASSLTLANLSEGDSKARRSTGPTEVGERSATSNLDGGDRKMTDRPTAVTARNTPTVATRATRRSSLRRRRRRARWPRGRCGTRTGAADGSAAGAHFGWAVRRGATHGSA